jgi:hypothetical protein
LFLGLGIGAVGDCDFAIHVTEGDGIAGGLEGFAADEMLVLAEFIVVSEALVHHGVTLCFRHGFELVGFDVSQADVFHNVLWFPWLRPVRY